jgi:hypothetical protein
MARLPEDRHRWSRNFLAIDQVDTEEKSAILTMES